MSGFDTTNVAATAPVNPFGVVSGIADMQNSLNQNKAFQAKALAGQYLEQATGPDGQPDLGKFSASLQRDPRTAPFAQEALQGVASLRERGLANQQANVNLTQSQYANAQQAIATAGNTSTSKVQAVRDAENGRNAASALAAAVASGRVSPEVAATMNASGAISPAAIRAATIGGAGGEGAKTAMTGIPVQTVAGKDIVTNLVNQFRNTATPMEGPGADITVTTTPGQKMVQLPVTDQASGIPGTASAGQVFNETGDKIPTPSISLPNGVLPTGLAPGEEQARGEVGKAEGGQASNLINTNAGSAGRESLLKELLAAQGDFRSGPSAAGWSKFVTDAKLYLPGLSLGDTSTPSQQVFSKISEQLALQQRNALGSSPTDLQTEMARQMSANNDNSPEANRRVAAIQLGNEKLIQAQMKAWEMAQGRGYKVTDFPHFQAQFNSTFDPRYFQDPYMTAAQRQETTRGMTDAQLKQYNAGVAYVKSKDFSK